jgi:hypothetical protein
MALSTIASGAKLRASFLNAIINAFNALSAIFDQKETVQAVWSTSGSSAIGTSATSILSIGTCTFKAGRAYSVENIGGVLGSTANEADFSIWKNGTAGTQIGAFYRTPTPGASQRNCYGRTYLINTAVTDVVFTTLNLAVAASTGTVTHDAFSNRPRGFVVRDVGLASAYAGSFVVT